MAAVGAMRTDAGRSAFLNDESAYVLCAVLQTAESDALREMAVSDPRSDIRAAALHSATTDRLRSMFFQDPERDIRQEAYRSVQDVALLEDALPHADFRDRRAVRSRISELREEVTNSSLPHGPVLS